MRRLIPILPLALVAACDGSNSNQYGFIARLGNDTVSAEQIVRSGNSWKSEEVDRWPRVRRRHTEITLLPTGGIGHLTMDIREPGGLTPGARDRHVTIDVTADSVITTVIDSGGTQRRAFVTGGTLTTVHSPMMYGLTELCLGAALREGAAKHVAAGDSIHVNQVYVDRDFDDRPLHEGWVRPLANGHAELWHDWLSGIGEAVFDSAYRMQSYSGKRTTYQVSVDRVTTMPDIDAMFKRLTAAEQAAGGPKQLSTRDTARGVVGKVSISVDYGRPLARGRDLLGNVIPYDEVWRTGANAATQFTTTAAIEVAGIALKPGTYTLWTRPKKDGTADLIVNRESGQWGTAYDATQDIGERPLQAGVANPPVEKFTISIVPKDATRGSLVLEWGPFRWVAEIVVR